MANYIHPTAVIGPNVQMGDNNYIGPFCIIGFPAEHKAFWEMEKVEEPWTSWGTKEYMRAKAGKVIIGNNNVFTGLVTVDAGTETDTVIFNNVWMMKSVHIGHDAIIHDNVTISPGARIGGHCIIYKGSNIGMNACMHQRTVLLEDSMLGMMSSITKTLKVEPNSVYIGSPAKFLRKNDRNIQNNKSDK